MPSHLSSIGMPVQTEEEMAALAEEASQSAMETVCHCGRYLTWQGEDGSELWLHIDKSNSLVGLTPSFSGKSVFVAGIAAEFESDTRSSFDGAIYGWADPQGEDPEDGEYPFVFDLVNRAVYGRFDLPFVSEIELSAFAHEITVHESDSDYYDSQKEECHFAAESFIPSGLFGDSSQPPEAFAVFSGRVLETKRLTNSLTGVAYHWALVQTLGGIVDVLIDPVLLNQQIVEGGVLSGYFWLNGKIRSPKTA